MQKYLYILFIFCICSLFQLSAVDNDGSRYALNSVLSQGNWYKIKVPATGVYKLTYEQLSEMGLTNPQNVKIYGYGGWILDEDFTKPYIDDLPQVSIWMSKEPASFGKGDYILFYARGDIKWTYDKQMKEFVHEQNPYSSDNYYFVTENAEQPKLIGIKPSLSTTTTVVTTFDDYFLHEKEEVNLAETGREFFGESFKTKTSQNFSLPLEGITADPAVIRYNFISRALMTSGKLSVSLIGGKVKEQPTNVTNNDYYIHATTINDTIVRNNLKADETLNLTYTKGMSTDQNIHLNYIRVNYKRYLKPYGAVTLFRDTISGEAVTFNISDAGSSVLVWDVTENTTVSKMDATLSGTTLSFGASNLEIREYALVDLAQTIPSPVIIKGAIKNQNLHASANPDMIIIVQPSLLVYAQQAAELHAKEGLTSLIATPDDIYNEFSSGKPDVTAYRRFVKMFYDRSTSEEEKPQYLFLFGGGTYDNRFIQFKENKESMLLTFQTKESLNEKNSYVTDDYLGFLDDKEGTNLATDKLDISIGRLPVRTKEEAEIAVKKIASYVQNQNIGIWENHITFIADDAIAPNYTLSSERRHMLDAERFATYTNVNHPDFIVNRIYQDSYERVIEANGARYPDATKAMLDRINRGTLALNFIGHGSTTSWTHEYLLKLAEIEAMDNSKLPLWITATCDFSRFDANDMSGGEITLLNPKGGAIALFSTVRVVFQVDNTRINNNITKHLLVAKEGKAARLGDIIRNAKLETDISNDENKLKFLLMGDPALRLGYPDKTYRVEVSEMNGLGADEPGINIQALGSTIIKGHIVDQNGDVVKDFNGTLETVIFDAEQTLKTRGNTPKGTSDEVAMDYKDFTNTLFSGKIEIKDGEFEINFIAPKDILYTGGKGKMSFYAYNVEKDKQAQGSFLNYTVGGTNPNPPEDTTPPVISNMFLNSASFKSGDVVNSTPLFFADVADDTGINISDGLGHNMVLILNGQTTLDMTPYFENEDNSSKRGSIRYQFSELEEGNYTLQLRVWDVSNNSATKSIDFVISNDFRPVVYDFQIRGNPARNTTRFMFNTNTPGANIDVKISVYSLMGHLVWVHEESGDFLTQYTYDWNLNGSNGGRLNPGVYICTAQISINGKLSTMKSQKLIIAN
ncbi:peptidase C25-like protein [Dysgonomonas alginatilytica]|uniref:Peptidase C25-like protein n=1 Tax=Dysgonomonas alginatilytica TaxID=1605892 RepID=A0A2V3PL89_9BACT|nr:type IX secretion system sortase PorU [Dysgonomonas alginatilytica]PXV60275.1 peptidase C25-like protein [Dysgonomonas alginatilytica]